MKIVFKYLKGNQFELDIEPSDLVSVVKAKIEEEQKIEVSMQKLVAVGKVMADDKTVEEYKLKEGDFIVVMVAKPKVKKEKKPEPAATTAPAASSNTGMNAPAQISMPNLMPSNANTAPAPTPSAEAADGGNGMMSGEQLEKTLVEMQEMGFPRDQCLKALRAAFYNPDRAVDYLLSGIPEGQGDQPAATTGAGAGAGAAMAGAGAGVGAGAGANPLQFLQNNPMFAQLRQRLVSEPQFFQTFMSQLAQTQPELHQAISQNPQAFLSLLLGQEGGEGGGDSDPPGTIRVTQEEKEAIERLTGLGFPKHRAIEAFMACDKNEEWAANYLFENNANDDNYDNEVAQEESRADAENDLPPEFQVHQPGSDVPMSSDQPDQNPPAQNEPSSEAQMNVDQPADNPPAENLPADNPPANNPPADNPPADNPPADNQPGGNNQNNENEEDESAF